MKLKEINVTGNSHDFYIFISQIIFNLGLIYAVDFFLFKYHIIRVFPIIVIILSLEYLNKVLYDNNYYDILIYENYFYNHMEGKLK